MSRRKGEFEHRTSIFEGAYRAWSHLGGVEPLVLSTSSAADLDPLSHPHENDSRVAKEGSRSKCSSPSPSSTGTGSSATPSQQTVSAASAMVTDSSGKKRCYPYEPLPRSGLAHPFVQAIISPWLGPDAEHDDIVLGLTTLRTWWQHRRKGESSSAKSALGTEKMRSVVEGYTRHFFNLAHCIVMNDGEQPPRTLCNKIKDCEKNGVKLDFMTLKKKDDKDKAAGAGTATATATASISGSIKSATPSVPLSAFQPPTSSDRNVIHHNHNATASGGSSTAMGLGTAQKPHSPNHHDPYGSLLNSVSNDIDMNSNHPMGDDAADRGTCCSVTGGGVGESPLASRSSPIPNNGKSYGDPNKTPVVFVSEGGDIQIAMVSEQF